MKILPTENMGNSFLRNAAETHEKRWGHEIWLANNEDENYCGKILYIKAGHNTSMHYHMEKHETFYITKGSLQVDLLDTSKGERHTLILKEGETFEVKRGQPQQLIAHGGDVEFIEISTFHKNKDSHRLWT